MTDLKLLKKLEGLQTIETIAETLNIKRTSALNLVSNLKKENYLTKTGGGKQKRIYKITTKKQRTREKGMFDIINKYSPMKINPWYDHQVHGEYTVENTIIDAIKTESFRTILASLKLYNHITNWPKLYYLAKQNNIWQKVGALHEVAKTQFRVRKMPKKYLGKKIINWKQITTLKNRNNFPQIQITWRTTIPFNKKDLEEIR